MFFILIAHKVIVSLFTTGVKGSIDSLAMKIVWNIGVGDLINLGGNDFLSFNSTTIINL